MDDIEDDKNQKDWEKEFDKFLDAVKEGLDDIDIESERRDARNC